MSFYGYSMEKLKRITTSTGNLTSAFPHNLRQEDPKVHSMSPWLHLLSVDYRQWAHESSQYSHKEVFY